MLATVVDTKELWETVVASLVGAVGITALFSLLIFGAARSTDARRDDHVIGAVVYGLVAFLALAATTGAVVLGIVVMLSK